MHQDFLFLIHQQYSRYKLFDYLDLFFLVNINKAYRKIDKLIDDKIIKEEDDQLFVI